MKKKEYEVKPNRKQKDSLFRFIFNDPERFLDAYNALMGTDIKDATQLMDVSLKGILFYSLLNDVAFVVEDKLVVMIEHQSTINDNMPLRLLMYVTRIYEELIGEERIYSEKRIPLYKPQFIVLYNGLKKYPSHKTLRLSEAYKTIPEELQPGIAGGMLELEVEVYNINKGNNEKLIERSEYLNGYVTFESIVANEIWNNKRKLAEALKIAYEYCQKNRIIADFLKKHMSEVKNMLYTEFDEELAKKTWQDEAREDGFLEGRAAGIAEGRTAGIAEGRTTGMAEATQTTAKRMLALGMSVEQISEVTLLSTEEIEAIKVAIGS